MVLGYAAGGELFDYILSKRFLKDQEGKSIALLIPLRDITPEKHSKPIALAMALNAIPISTMLASYGQSNNQSTLNITTQQLLT
jgi:hypothetical protein